MTIVDIDTIDLRFFNAVRTNKQEIYDPAGHGDNFLTAYNAWAWTGDAQRDRIAKHDVNAWMNDTLGIPPGQGSRIKTILLNATWRGICHDWTSHVWGRTSFKLDAFANAAGLGLDEVSARDRTLGLCRR